MSTPYPLCKLCGTKEASCRAHIIPRQFYHRIRKQSPHLLTIEISASIKKSTTQSGIYERGILCTDCDGKIGRLDNYAYKVLPATPDATKFFFFTPHLRIYQLGEINVKEFQRFLVSLAWRSGVAKHRLFQGVKLGVYEDRFKKVLLETDQDALQDVSAVICLYQPPKFDGIVWPPRRRKLDEINVIQFYLYPWKVLLKVDNRKFTDPFDKLALVAGRPAVAMVQDYLSPGEIRTINSVKRRVKPIA